jgi:4-hydroxy-3-polyprenylbenzoate decarboxylase
VLDFDSMRIFVGISGASGQLYAGRLLKALHEGGHDVTACFSDAAVAVMRAEDLSGMDLEGAPRANLIEAFLAVHGIIPGDLTLAMPDDMSSAFASGSSLAEAAVICPCSMNTFASIAAGVTRNLIHRTADVMLKESRPLVLVPRETPLSQIHLRNMLTLSRAGANIVPAMPAFYQKPETIEDLADFMAGKVLDILKINHELYRRWRT